MSRSPIALAVLLFAALLMPTSAAQAAYTVMCTGYTSCEGKGYSHAGYESHQGKSYWNMYTGTNCTNYVAYRLVTTNGMPNTRPKSGVGNARDWGTAMKSVTDNVATVGSVAWWGKTGNHVAYVEKVVSSTEIWVSESNWSRPFDWRKITKSGSGWPDGFIHFSDPKIVNQTKPAVIGVPKVDTAISASGGSWSPTGNTYAYQWLADGAAISGATTKKFTPAATQMAKKLSVRVTATRPSYPTVKATSTAIEVAPGTFAQAAAPTLSGTPKVDSMMTATSRASTPAATTLTYVWFAGGTAISGARSATFAPGPEHVGQQLSVRITSKRAGYTTLETRSAPTAVVAPGDLSTTVRPMITGTVAVGSRVSTSTGTWSKPGLVFSYQWRANGVAIPGATGSFYEIAPTQRGKTLDVVVTARRDGYATTATPSGATVGVVRGTFTALSRPAISGTPRVGSRLTASSGTWSPDGAYSFQWYAGNTPIKDATARTYLPTRFELGDRIRVTVTARRDGFTTAASRSVPTPAITAGHISVSKTARVVGSPRLGNVLRVDPGVHLPTASSARYQWLRDGKVLSGATRSTRRVSVNDLGHQLTVKVTLRASGYSTRNITTAKIGRAMATAKLSASASNAARGKVTFAVKVSASGAPSPDGTVTISAGGKKLVTAKVKRGRATVTLTKQPAGSRTYSLRFNGTSSVTSAVYNRTMTVN